MAWGIYMFISRDSQECSDNKTAKMNTLRNICSVNMMAVLSLD